MKGRLFEILYYLLDVKQTTAQQLAEHFEVSQRTIYRDLDRLLVAGIPIMTTQGSGGGISIDKHFVLDKTLLNHQEQEQILSALQSLSSLHLNEYQELLNRMKGVFQHESQEWIEVDFSSWQKSEETNKKFNLLKEAILQYHTIKFTYVNMQGEQTERYVNPLKIIFKGSAWYLQAYEMSKKDYRTFKLSRMNKIILQDEYFDISVFPDIPSLFQYQKEPQQIDVVLRFQKYLGSFIYDEFEYKDIEEKQDCYIVKAQLSYHEWFMSFLLSFGQGVEVIEPITLRDDLKKEIMKMYEIYK